MNEPRIAAIARKRYARVWPGSGRKFTLYTTNHLLRDHYPGAIGLKTGYTNPAGFCLVAIVQRGSAADRRSSCSAPRTPSSTPAAWRARRRGSARCRPRPEAAAASVARPRRAGRERPRGVVSDLALGRGRHAPVRRRRLHPHRPHRPCIRAPLRESTADRCDAPRVASQAPSTHDRQEAAMATPYTLKKLTDVKDSAPEFGLGDIQEARFAGERPRRGGHRRRASSASSPTSASPFGHVHENAEEIYVVLSGSGRAKLDDEIVDLGAARRAARRADGHPRLRGRSRRPRAARLRPASQGRRRDHPGLVGRLTRNVVVT